MKIKTNTKKRDLILTVIAVAALVGILAFLEANKAQNSYTISIIERSCIYAVVAVSMNLLTGFTGLFGEKVTDKV